ncbi:hypothetical protein RIVM261_059760 [Rivularia sp. IAM M-261]|nr:hypothetical protein CAL7716_035180 [Calothrix sp. PCC 7716]GJD21020.1 hypothetical protein RIVM261_059760 [Rivularia sp. IAM M-261]
MILKESYRLRLKFSTLIPEEPDQGINRYIFRKENECWKICEMIFEQQKLADYIGVPETIQRSMAQTAIERGQEQERK